MRIALAIHEDLFLWNQNKPRSQGNRTETCLYGTKDKPRSRGNRKRLVSMETNLVSMETEQSLFSVELKQTSFLWKQNKDLFLGIGEIHGRPYREAVVSDIIPREGVYSENAIASFAWN